MRPPRLRIGELSRRVGVREATLRAWEARYGLLEPERTQGNFRLYGEDDIRRIEVMLRLLEAGVPAAEAARLARGARRERENGDVPSGIVARARAGLRRAFFEFDEGLAERALDELFEEFAPEAVLRDAIYPFMREVGDAWACGDASAANEHFASAVIQARLLSVARGWGAGAGPRAMLACAPGEQHALGLIGFGICLARRGWRITYLGPAAPLPAIVHAAGAVEPDLVMISAHDPLLLRPWAQALHDLRRHNRVALAGRGATRSIAEYTRCDRVTTDPVEAAELLSA